ncbi:hypothetical protein C8D77_10883 [Mesorhizobium loti]|uniref:Uncharacterized protein n=1 Tax=Rhizobium loti TaxID=381 RepID=A0A8E2W9P3_RHILI|nr:hypothetical protein C8D77_10883 [Mesorhizobium loti]
MVSAMGFEPRDRRSVFFTVVPVYEGIQAKSNRDWKPTFKRSDDPLARTEH